jgi:hypothetical protein
MAGPPSQWIVFGGTCTRLNQLAEHISHNDDDRRTIELTHTASFIANEDETTHTQRLRDQLSDALTAESGTFLWSQQEGTQR